MDIVDQDTVAFEASKFHVFEENMPFLKTGHLCLSFDWPTVFSISPASLQACEKGSNFFISIKFPLLGVAAGRKSLEGSA